MEQCRQKKKKKCYSHINSCRISWGVSELCPQIFSLKAAVTGLISALHGGCFCPEQTLRTDAKLGLLDTAHELRSSIDKKTGDFSALSIWLGLKAHSPTWLVVDFNCAPWWMRKFLSWPFCRKEDTSSEGQLDGWKASSHEVKKCYLQVT